MDLSQDTLDHSVAMDLSQDTLRNVCSFCPVVLSHPQFLDVSVHHLTPLLSLNKERRFVLLQFRSLLSTSPHGSSVCIIKYNILDINKKAVAPAVVLS